jgi:uncharacterized protein
MSANKATYLDSSALVKLAVREPESAALRRYLRRRRPLIASALARPEVARALLPLGPDAVRRGHDVLTRVDMVRINDRVLDAAGAMLPVELRSLDAIHLATAQQLGADLAGIVTYDDRLAAAAVPSHRSWPGSTPLTCGGSDSLRRRPAGCLTEVGPRAPFSRRCLTEPGPRWPFSQLCLIQPGPPQPFSRWLSVR